MTKTELEWYSVKEKLPEDRKFVLACYYINNNSYWYDYVWYNKRYNTFEHPDYDIQLEDVIAWAKLPESAVFL